MLKKPGFEELNDKDHLALARLDSIFRNNGYDPETERHVAMKDTLDITGAAFLIPRVLTTFVQEGLEPLLIGTSLLQRIDYVPGMQTVFPAIDVLTAREVGDGMALPIHDIHVGGAQTFGVSVRRHGLALRISQRFIDASTYPWLQWWMKLAGQALARHKEEYIFSFITSLGVSVFDNAVASRTAGATIQPVKGHTTGRNLKGQFNGSMTMDDIYDMYAQILMQGFIPDTLLVHPMTWLMWVKDAQLRDFAITAGGGSFFANFTGNPAAKAYEGQYNFQGLGPGLGQSGTYTQGTLGGAQGKVQNLPQTQRSGPVLPSYLGMNFRIVVSPFVRFDPITRTTDMMMFDSKSLGAMIVDEDPHVNSWTEPMYSIQNIGIEESYGFGILNEGQGIATAKNVKVKANEFLLPARSYVPLDGTAFEANNHANVFGNSPTDVNAR